MSLDNTQPPQFHYELGKRLSTLRQKNVLIIGSGNMVHNLSRISFSHPESAYDWALDAQALFKKLILSEDHASLIRYRTLGSAISLAIPTAEHFLPLLYILGMKNPKEHLRFFNEKTVLGAISMDSLLISHYI